MQNKIKIQKSPNGDYAITPLPVTMTDKTPHLKFLMDFASKIHEQGSQFPFVELFFNQLPKSWHYRLSVYSYINRVKCVICREKRDGEIVNVVNGMSAYTPHQFDADYWFPTMINIPLPIMAQVSTAKLWRLYFGSESINDSGKISAWAFKPLDDDVCIGFVL